MEKQQEQSKKKDLIKGSPITVLQANLIEKQRNSKYNAFQRRVCKIIRVEPADTYQYLFKVSYKGSTHVKVNDIIYNSENLAFVVIKTSLRLLVIVSVASYVKQPIMKGTLMVFKGDTKI
jgi:hypothetical protein